MSGSVKKRRIELIDVAKALTIFCVIFGHTVGNLDTPAYRLVLYSFHMPLFFMLAGMSMKVKPLLAVKDWLSFLFKNILSLLVPYFIWGMIYSQSSYDIALPNLLYGSWECLVKMNTLTSLWFLSCFFIARILTELVIALISLLHIKKVALACGICAVLMLAIGLVLPHGEKGWFFCTDVAFVASAFILAGVAFKMSILILAQERNWILALCFILSSLMFCFGTFFRLDDLGLYLMCGAIYVSPFWFIWNGVSGSMVILSISMLIERISRESMFTFSVDAITFIGKRTLGIFLVHKQFLSYLVMPFLNAHLSGVLHEALIAFIGACIMLPVSCGICVVIEKFVPQLLGQFPRIVSEK